MRSVITKSLVYSALVFVIAYSLFVAIGLIAFVGFAAYWLAFLAPMSVQTFAFGAALIVAIFAKFGGRNG